MTCKDCKHNQDKHCELLRHCITDDAKACWRHIPRKTLLDNVAEWDKAIEKRGYVE